MGRTIKMLEDAARYGMLVAATCVDCKHVGKFMATDLAGMYGRHKKPQELHFTCSACGSKKISVALEEWGDIRQFVRVAVEPRVLSLTGQAIGGIDYDAPKGDPGLFGPGSVCWRVHGDFPSMSVGGVSALLLQMLHPLALAGVWDHSNFRDDSLGGSIERPASSRRRVSRPGSRLRPKSIR